ncbi:MAG: YHS domain-containing protein, partial [Planctomycetes bacterium]|nr:YHS domain-containing protein [Planctomycetota bacterium]
EIDERERRGAPVNDKCPVSGEPIDRSKTVEHEGRVVAFCCDKCKAKFEADPAAFADKLPPAPGAEAAAKPINDKCPVSGEAVDPAQTVVHDGRVVAFCCGKCKAKFEADPAKFADRLPVKK